MTYRVKKNKDKNKSKCYNENNKSSIPKGGRRFGIIFSHDVNSQKTIETLNILLCLMDVSESELIYDDRKYRELFRFIRLSLGIKTSILCKIRELKKKIKELI